MKMKFFISLGVEICECKERYWETRFQSQSIHFKDVALILFTALQLFQDDWLAILATNCHVLR